MSVIEPEIVSIALLTVATIFAGSAAIKFAALEDFGQAVEAYRVVPESTAPVVAWIVPVLELGSAAGLLYAGTRSAAAMILFVLLILFTLAIGLNLARGRRDIDCGCFGPMLRQRLSSWLIVRNFVLAGGVMVAALPLETSDMNALAYSTIAFASMAMVLLYITGNVLLANSAANEELRDA